MSSSSSVKLPDKKIMVTLLVCAVYVDLFPFSHLKRRFPKAPNTKYFDFTEIDLSCVCLCWQRSRPEKEICRCSESPEKFVPIHQLHIQLAKLIVKHVLHVQIHSACLLSTCGTGAFTRAGGARFSCAGIFLSSPHMSAAHTSFTLSDCSICHIWQPEVMHLNDIFLRKYLRLKAENGAVF